MRWILALALCAPSVARAQIDYRNLSDGRPTVAEDAHAVERYAFEWSAGGRLERAASGWSHAVGWRVEYGVLLNAEVGFSTVRGNNSAWRVSALYNANTEGPWLPALAVRAEASLDEPQASIKLIATRSFGRHRVHLNAGRTFGRAGGSAVEIMPREFGSVAVDRTLFRRSTLLLAEVSALRDDVGVPLAVNASLGMRYQWTPTTVLDVGLGRGLSGDGPDFAVTIGMSLVFGVKGLMP